MEMMRMSREAISRAVNTEDANKDHGENTAANVISEEFSNSGNGAFIHRTSTEMSANQN